MVEWESLCQFLVPFYLNFCYNKNIKKDYFRINVRLAIKLKIIDYLEFEEAGIKQSCRICMM